MDGNTPDRKLLKQVNGIQSRVGSALLNTDLAAEEVVAFPVKTLGEVMMEAANLIVARIRGIEPGRPYNVLVQNEDGSISFTKTVRGRSDEELVSEYKAADWSHVNPAIRKDRRIEISGKPEAEIGAQRTLTIKNVVPSGKTWKLDKVMATIGASAVAFDLEDLTDLVIGHRDELLVLGIRWIVAPAARFRNGDGVECVVYAGLEYRELDLDWIEREWYDDDFFGSSK